MPINSGDDKPTEESIYDTPSKVTPFDPTEIEEPVSHTPTPELPADVPSAQDYDKDQSPEADESEKDDQPALPTFDSRVKDEFRGLMFLGALTSEFDWTGHSFKIRTLTVGEFIEVGLAVKRYEGTMAYDRAWQAAVVAACIISIDNRPMPIPVTNDPSDTPFNNAFQYVLDKWFAPTIEAVYVRYVELELLVGQVVESMGKATG